MDITEIQSLKKEIEARLQNKYGDIKVWRHKEYEEISDLIFAKTKLKLSYMTLKRILGNVKYGSTPNSSTLNALAQFIDYKNWDEYKDSLSTNPINSTNTTSKITKANKFKYQNILLISALFLILGILSIYFFYKIKNNNISIKLTTSTPIIKSPGVIQFNYDISKIKDDSVFIDFGKGLNDAKILLDKKSKSYIKNFSMPGILKISICSNKKKYDSLSIIALSNNWERFFTYNMPNGVLNTALPKIKKSESVLSTNNSDFVYVGYDTIIYYQSDFRFFDTLAISLDDFIIETRIKNEFRVSNFISCRFAALKIYSLKSSIKINFTDENCYENAYFYISDNRIAGNQRRYESLGVNLLNWQKIKIRVKNKVAILFINDIEKMRMKYTKDMGLFCGIQYQFSRTGAVDYIRLFNDKGILVYNNDF